MSERRYRTVLYSSLLYCMIWGKDASSEDEDEEDKHRRSSTSSSRERAFGPYIMFNLTLQDEKAQYEMFRQDDTVGEASPGVLKFVPIYSFTPPSAAAVSSAAALARVDL